MSKSKSTNKPRVWLASAAVAALVGSLFIGIAPEFWLETHPELARKVLTAKAILDGVSPVLLVVSLLAPFTSDAGVGIVANTLARKEQLEKEKVRWRLWFKDRAGDWGVAVAAFYILGSKIVDVQTKDLWTDLDVSEQSYFWWGFVGTLIALVPVALWTRSLARRTGAPNDPPVLPAGVADDPTA